MFIALGLLVAGITAQATEYAGILVTMIDGTSTTIRIDEKPIVTISNNKLIIKTTEATAEFDRAKVARFNFLDEESGIDGVQANESAFVKQEGDLFIFNNLPADSEIKIYNLEGVLMKNETATGDYALSTADLISGVYIVSVNGVSTKIAVTR